jgi:carbon-monoxide dehydrogenase small subunit
MEALMKQITITVNGKSYELRVKPWATLLDCLRDDLGLTGTKEGCGLGECGACTVLMDGTSVNACLVMAPEADGKEIITIEGLAQGDTLHPIQAAFVKHGAIQCGFCTAGMVLAAKALLDENPDPTDEEIRRGIAGNFCRCTGYTKIFTAIRAAARGDQ